MSLGHGPYPGEGPVRDKGRLFPRLARIRARVAHVESIYGDPWVLANASGLHAVNEAARRGRLAPLSVQRYFYARLQDELVPRDLGGRFEALDQLALTHRALFRRDPAVGHAVGFTPFIAALLVYLNGTALQQSSVSETLLHRGLLGVAFPLFARGEDLQGTEFAVVRGEGGYEINGVKLDIGNAHTSDQIVAFARSGDRPDEYSLMLVDPAAANPATVLLHPAVSHCSIRGAEYAGIEFSGHRVSPDALIGGWSQGLAAGADSLPAVHALLPALLIGLGDTALRQAALTEMGRGGRAKSNAVALADCLVDLLVADAMSLVAARSVQVQPGESAVVAAASRYVVPTMLWDLLTDLAPFMGDGFHATTGNEAVVAKHLADLTQIAFTGVGLSNALNTITPFLGVVGSRTAEQARAVDPDLFRLDVEPPCLAAETLRHYGGDDGLLAYLAQVPEKLDQSLVFPGDSDEFRAVRDLVSVLQKVVGELRTGCARLGVDERSSSSFALANRYAHTLAAVSAIGLWLNSGSGDHDFVRSTTWLRVALHRTLGRLGHVQPPLPVAVYEVVLDELWRRCEASVSLDLFSVPVGGAR